ncbi:MULTISPECIES: hypothetical protein [Chryseobacterium]|uniref:hypothetical protein n=1 Tax=Chryseobacterium TaxID=59732 RepID=UPI001BEC906B|nr:MULTISPECIES: hypothetical protein [Chryseobacterium]MBT2622505.1 hypothetical protein [Chryseobacterium sp. ISL-6]
MAKKIITRLKEYFQAGRRPTEEQFGDLLDSYVHLDNPEFVRSEDVGSTREGILKFFTTEYNTDKIFHVKMPYRTNTDSKMFHIRASGYNYQNGDIIDVTWVGYCYQPSGALMNNKTYVAASTAIIAGQYVGTDSHIYLWFKLPNIYYSSFKVDSMRVGNGTLLKEGDLELIVINTPQL